MALRKILARDIIIQVESSTPNTWLQIGGVTSATPNPGENAEDADITDFNSGGRPEAIPVQRGASIAIEGQQILDSITGDPDPGQGRCDELGDTLGYNGQGRIRFRHPLQTTWKIWTAVFTPGEQGGGNNDPGAWNTNITRSGAATSAAVV